MDLDTFEDEDKISIEVEGGGDIVLSKVKFRYGTRLTVFESLDLTIKRGAITVIVGESGSGKSTIASILKRLYPIESGKVMIGNYLLDSIKESDLNKVIGLIPQQIDLFEGTVIENIALGDFYPDTNRIIQLAEEIGALDFINDLPGAFNARLGENGVNLSGGQRQRLAILRTLYFDPSIIIFDEATSALDKRSEDLVIRTMERLKNNGKTVIAITHRIRPALIADKVVFLDSGKMIAEGQHQELIGSNVEYQKFWQDS